MKTVEIVANTKLFQRYVSIGARAKTVSKFFSVQVTGSMFGGTTFSSDAGRNETLNNQKIGKTIAIPPAASTAISSQWSTRDRPFRRIVMWRCSRAGTGTGSVSARG